MVFGNIHSSQPSGIQEIYQKLACASFITINAQFLNPNSQDNKGSCWILLDFYCSVTMLRDIRFEALHGGNRYRLGLR